MLTDGEGGATNLKLSHAEVVRNRKSAVIVEEPTEDEEDVKVQSPPMARSSSHDAYSQLNSQNLLHATSAGYDD